MSGPRDADLEAAVRLVLAAGLSTGHADTTVELVGEVLDQFTDLTGAVKQMQAAVKQMLDVYRAATSGQELVSNQGQALDGYSELENYRSILRNLVDPK